VERNNTRPDITGHVGDPRINGIETLQDGAKRERLQRLTGHPDPQGRRHAAR
jgi:hypothetical protein